MFVAGVGLPSAWNLGWQAAVPVTAGRDQHGRDVLPAHTLGMTAAPTPQEHEAALVRFVSPAKRERVAALLTTARGRRKLVADLPHFGSWHEESVVPLTAQQQTAQAVLGELQRRGAPGVAYLTSARRALDARTLPLADAVREVVGSSSGTVISCIPGRLAYYEDEEHGARWILWSGS